MNPFPGQPRSRPPTRAEALKPIIERRLADGQAKSRGFQSWKSSEISAPKKRLFDWIFDVAGTRYALMTLLLSVFVKSDEVA